MENKMTNAKNLDDLCEALIEAHESADIELRETDDDSLKSKVESIMCMLPTFGGDAPASTHGVFSWDATRLLVQVGDSRRFAIVERDDDDACLSLGKTHENASARK